MIEKFSKEELAQILKELGVEKPPVPRKSVVCIEQRKRILDMIAKEMYPETKEVKPNGLTCGIYGEHARDDIFNAVVTLIDYTLENFVMSTDRYKQPEYRRATTVKECDAPKYKKMFNEILDVIEKYHN